MAKSRNARNLISRDPVRYVVVDARGDRKKIAETVAGAVLEKLMRAEQA